MPIHERHLFEGVYEREVGRTGHDTRIAAFRLRYSKRGERIAEATRLREGPIRALR